jgi:hypothetical protein
MTCRIEGCERGGKLARGWCSMHYRRWRIDGGPGEAEPRKLPFWEQVDVGHPAGGWEWTGYSGPRGYGHTGQGDAHRQAYEGLVGPVPAGLQLDHLCQNTLCVNPDHLQPVTAQENQHRSHSVSGRNRRKRECPNGHAYTSENTYTPPTGGRACRACARVQWRKTNERRSREAAERRAAGLTPPRWRCVGCGKFAATERPCSCGRAVELVRWTGDRWDKAEGVAA